MRILIGSIPSLQCKLIWKQSRTAGYAQGSAFRVAADYPRGSLNWFHERPVVVSFEVTDSCTCFCKHCDHGGPRDMSRDMKPADYRRYMEALKPCVVQVSGGEPLLRRRRRRCRPQHQSRTRPAIHHPGLQLVADDRGAVRRAARGGGRPVLRQPRLSRRTPRRFPRASRALRAPEPDRPRLAALGHDDIVLNNCITAENVVGNQRHCRQGKRVGGQHQLQRLLSPPHRMPGLLPQLTRTAVHPEAASWHGSKSEWRARAGSPPPTPPSKPPSSISRPGEHPDAKPGCAGWSLPATVSCSPARCSSSATRSTRRRR